MRRSRGGVCSGLALALASSLACSGGSEVAVPVGTAAVPPLRTRVIDIGPLRIDGIHRSMDGPWDRVRFDPSEVGWITRFKTEVLDGATDEPAGDQFFCHSQLQLDNTTRLLMAATGSSEIRFPEGFGMPLERILRGVPAEWRGLSLLGMVLNNHEPDLKREVRVRITLDYARPDDPAAASLKKLYKLGLPLSLKENAVLLEGEPPRPAAVEWYKGLTGHWMVPPGPQIARQRYRRVVPVPATVHYGVVHLHNHGRYVRLTDLTERRVLWQTEVVYEPERVQIAAIPPFSSVEGFRMHPDHEYELEAFYHNTASQPVDAMASMHLYYHPDGNVDISYPSPPPAAADHAHH
jgi:hypothetical protein